MRRLVIYAIILTVCSLAACGPSGKEKAQADKDSVSVVKNIPLRDFPCPKTCNHFKNFVSLHVR